jgi:hypothetical protein
MKWSKDQQKVYKILPHSDVEAIFQKAKGQVQRKEVKSNRNIVAGDSVFNLLVF